MDERVYESACVCVIDRDIDNYINYLLIEGVKKLLLTSVHLNPSLIR